MQILGANIQKIDSVVAFYRKHDESMLAMRARNKKYDNMIDKMYNERVEQIKREGATKENTLWL